MEGSEERSGPNLQPLQETQVSDADARVSGMDRNTAVSTYVQP
jgi:hypothetical protein